jgi:hypothetical protein
VGSIVLEARIRWARALFLLRGIAPGRMTTATVTRMALRLRALAGGRTAPVTLARVVQTSSGCPAQWDGWDEEGRYYYLRYRYGTGEVRQYRTPDWHRTRKDELIRVVTTFEHGHPLDGVIALGEFAENAGITIAAGAALTGFWDHARDELVMRGMTELLGEGAN